MSAFVAVCRCSGDGKTLLIPPPGARREQSGVPIARAVLRGKIIRLPLRLLLNVNITPSPQRSATSGNPAPSLASSLPQTLPDGATVPRPKSVPGASVEGTTRFTARFRGPRGQIPSTWPTRNGRSTKFLLCRLCHQVFALPIICYVL